MFPFGMLVILACKLGLTTISGWHQVPNGQEAHAGIRVKRNGDVQEKSGTWSTQNILTEWFTQACKTATIGDDYECYLSGTGDTPTGDALDTWLAVTVDREWLLDKTGAWGEVEFTGTMQIREIADPPNIVSAAVTIHAQVESP